MKKLILLLLAAVTAFFSACSSGKDQEESQNEESKQYVEVMKIQEQSISREIEYTADLKAFKEVHLVPSSPGKIENIQVEVGQWVKKGDLIVQMDRTQLHQADIQYKNMKTEYNRMDTLIKTGSISEQQYDQIKAQYDIAVSNRAFLAENVNVRAPISGIITAKYFENGEMYSGAPNTQAGKAAIVSIQDIRNLLAVIHISEQYYPLVKEGMETEIRCEIFPEEIFKGKIYKIYPTINPASRTFQIEVSIPNPKAKLRPGMFARVSLSFGEVEAFVVPASAVQQQEGTNEKFIFIYENGVANKIKVDIGKRFDDKVEIVSNAIKAGDQLIISGQSRLMDKSKVTIVKN